ncbi:TonB-dependent siderophore receptor [Massilia sp. CCM 8733]|uniref:TonB-dependent siderophore receptor n=1 Tax=Massilia mucilaginosa TaxID=2609282 RepID=A0ABX0NSS8_9BURK|nr:TonB-dependent receptor [Massilia mucilaginosa]NHZ89845.1 TonB-dependent siderophore receptor [Massilia mucilaginosa]
MQMTPRKRLLSAALRTAFGLGASAWSGAATAQAARELTPITVTATRESLPGEAPLPYAGGQVARGARLGMLGNADNMAVPFNVTAYTAELMVNQQARSLADVMANDPAVQMNGPWYFDNFYIRGFAINRQEIGFDGMYGIASAEGNVLQGVERVEVLKGPSTLISGSAPRGAAGGAINLVPKRAADTALTQLTASYLSDANIGAHLDVGRRFGADNAFGARINLAHRAGEVQADHEKQRASSISAGLDYRGERLRASADFGTSKQMLDGAKSNFYVPGALLPAAPDGKNNAWPAWSYQDKENSFGVLRAEADATDTLSVGAAYGGARAKRRMISPFGELRASGDIDFYGSGFAEETDTSSAEASMRLRLATGPLKHQLVATATRFSSDLTADNPNLADSPRSNIYRPATLPQPADLGLDGPQLPSSSTRMTSYALADTISLLGERLLLTAGVRRQQMRVTAFGWQTGAFVSEYKKSATTPAAGAVFKVSPRWSVYGNYVEALSQGPVAPLNAVNRNDVFAPIVSRQGEAGVKLDLGRLSMSLSAFQIRKPSGFLDAANVYRIAGQQRNRGVEWQAAGEAAGGLRVLGGLTWTDGVLTRTRNAEFDGKSAAGVPEWVAKLGAEWDLAQVPGLTATARVQHVSAQAFNASNSVEMPGWTRIDLGARYATRIAGRPVVLRASVENLADRRYWDTVPAYQVVTYAPPRTVLLSATVDF